MCRLIVIYFLLCFPHCGWSNSILKGSQGGVVQGRVITNFLQPWAMTFINKDQMLVTSRLGKLWLVSYNGKKIEVSGVPDVFVGGQGGLGDVVLHPEFIKNQLVYLSFIESDGSNPSQKGAVVARGILDTSTAPILRDVEIIWRQRPKTEGLGHFSHRIAFGLIGSKHQGKLFVTSGDRQAQLPAQDWTSALGKVIRLNDDGSLPTGNPFQDKGELAKSFWTLGHRNALGLAFDKLGRLWSHEMGPRHGDELNLIQPGKNYGWPIVSEGNHYDGRVIPNHNSRVGFEAPIAFWVPTIAPSGLFFYSGDQFDEWKGNAFVGGLKSRALIRIEFDGSNATEVERFEWGSRVREVEQGPDGSILVLEDNPIGRLIQFTKPGWEN
jgi:glucose/arabinose dehydrogenase